MEIHNVHYVIFSPCGGTEKATKALGREIALPAFEHNLTLPVNRLKNISFGPNDLAIFGVPVYAGRIPSNMAAIFTKLKGENTPCALVAVYGNRAVEGAWLDMYSSLIFKGFKPVAAVAAIAEHSIDPDIAANRPDDDDRELLAKFGKQIVERAKSGASLKRVPGAYPTWKRPGGAPLFPITEAETCIKCGDCAEICPAEAIPASDPGQTNNNNCLMCGACVKYCPQKARQLGSLESREKIKAFLQASAAARKEAELFL